LGRVRITKVIDLVSVLEQSLKEDKGEGFAAQATPAHKQKKPLKQAA
jgi:hypothetical protein